MAFPLIKITVGIRKQVTSLFFFFNFYLVGPKAGNPSYIH
jgi:hypothetical protein